MTNGELKFEKIKIKTLKINYKRNKTIPGTEHVEKKNETLTKKKMKKLIQCSSNPRSNLKWRQTKIERKTMEKKTKWTNFDWFLTHKLQVTFIHWIEYFFFHVIMKKIPPVIYIKK